MEFLNFSVAYCFNFNLVIQVFYCVCFAEEKTKEDDIQSVVQRNIEINRLIEQVFLITVDQGIVVIHVAITRYKHFSDFNGT